MNLKRAALMSMAALAFIQGLVAIWVGTSHQMPQDFVFWFSIVGIFASLFLLFLWLRGDEIEYRVHRSAAMNMGIVALGLVFVPIYLWRARPKGRKAKAIVLFFLCLPAWYGFAVLGGIAGAMIFGLPGR